MNFRSVRFRIPLRTPFRGLDFREGTVFEGPAGWGEFSPFPGFGGLRERCMEAALESAFNAWPKPLRSRIPVYTTIPELSPDEAVRIMREGGTGAAKVKVGRDERLDLDRVEAVSGEIASGGFLSVDANGAWELDEAVDRIRALVKVGVSLVEQPVGSIDKMSELRKRVDVPLAADESFQSIDDAAEIRKKSAADVLVAKVQYLGGLRRALDAIEHAQLPVIVSSPIETSVGIGSGAALAAALDDLEYPCGLDTAGLLTGDLTATPIRSEGGFIEPRRVIPDEELLSRYGIGE